MFNVPFWVYVLFFGILYIGVKRCFARVIRIDRLLLFPAIFAIFGMRGVVMLFGMDFNGFICLMLGVSIGAMLGLYLVQNTLVQADKINRLIKLPGDFSMFALLLIIFFLEFFVHYAVDSHLSFYSSLIFRFSAVTISGIIMGISIGRNIMYYYKYRRCNSSPLTLS